MIKIKFIFYCLPIIMVALFSCQKETDLCPELYREYLSVELTSINNKVEDTIYQIQIFNSQDKIFEQDCNLIYSLFGESSEIVLNAEENLVNMRIPDDPSLGYLNIQGGGQFTKVSNINILDWKDKSLQNLENGDYILQVTLFIDDPFSPHNLVSSNKITFKKN